MGLQPTGPRSGGPTRGDGPPDRAVRLPEEAPPPCLDILEEPATESTPLFLEVVTEYNAWSGTSMATPHVTAAVALMLARNAKLTIAEVADQLARSARKVEAMRHATRSRAYGYGLLDLPAALA